MNECSINKDIKGVDIIDYDGVGYKPAVKFEAWRVAYLRYSEAFENVKKLERHNETDEVFVLLEGEATLIIGEEQEKVPMIQGKIYNVLKGTWHAIKASEDAKVLIVENDNTTVENTDYIYFETPIM